MKSNYQNNLYNAFPRLFRQKDLGPKESCLYWGIETGDGWFPLLYTLCLEIEEIYANLDEEEKAKGPYEAVQVKEKFGGLRFYMSNETEEMTQAIRNAEVKASRTCKQCSDAITTKIGICETCRKKG